MNNKNTIKKGFSLIEVLVVVSIIGILSSLIYVNFNEARNQSRNRALQTQLKEVQLAIELYKSQNGSYPPTQIDSFWNARQCFDSVVGGVAIAATNELQNGTGPLCPELPIIEHQSGNVAGAPADTVGFGDDYIKDFPSPNDSANSNCHFVYKVDSVNRSWYKLEAINCLSDVDDNTGIQETDELALCPKSCETSPGTCGENTMNSAYTDSTNFYQSLAVYSPGGNCQ